MFTIGSILYFNLFHFSNTTSASKPKYFVVIKHLDSGTLLAALPSSQKHLPYDLQAVYGCIELPDSGIGCYAFEGGLTIAGNGFAFPRDSYVYGQHLDQYDADYIVSIYPYEGIDYEIKGILLPSVLTDIITCLKNSNVVKRRFKKYL